eukprot:3849103-Prymnesium_polylepis.1
MGYFPISCSLQSSSAPKHPGILPRPLRTAVPHICGRGPPLSRPLPLSPRATDQHLARVVSRGRVARLAHVLPALGAQQDALVPPCLLYTSDAADDM